MTYGSSFYVYFDKEGNMHELSPEEYKEHTLKSSPLYNKDINENENLIEEDNTEDNEDDYY
jgi:hypothetical protein